jgi:hypothetical protein
VARRSRSSGCSEGLESFIRAARSKSRHDAHAKLSLWRLLGVLASSPVYTSIVFLLCCFSCFFACVCGYVFRVWVWELRYTVSFSYDKLCIYMYTRAPIYGPGDFTLSYIARRHLGKKRAKKAKTRRSRSGSSNFELPAFCCWNVKRQRSSSALIIMMIVVGTLPRSIAPRLFVERGVY